MGTSLLRTVNLCVAILLTAAKGESGETRETTDALQNRWHTLRYIPEHPTARLVLSDSSRTSRTDTNSATVNCDRVDHLYPIPAQDNETQIVYLCRDPEIGDPPNSRRGRPDFDHVLEYQDRYGLLFLPKDVVAKTPTSQPGKYLSRRQGKDISWISVEEFISNIDLAELPPEIFDDIGLFTDDNVETQGADVDPSKATIA